MAIFNKYCFFGLNNILKFSIPEYDNRLTQSTENILLEIFLHNTVSITTKRAIPINVLNTMTSGR